METPKEPLPDQIQSMQDELREILPSFISNSLNSVTGLLRITCPDPSDPIADQPTSQETSNLQDLAIPDAPHSISHVLNEATTILNQRVVTQHPDFFSFIPSTMLPISWLADVVVAAFNPHVGGRFAGSGSNIIEDALMAWFVEQVGFPAETAGGLTVSGGSMANLMALMAARDRFVPGPDQHARATVYLSDETHFSIPKAVRMLGFEEKQIRTVPGLQAEALQSMIQKDRAEGLIPMAVVATLGATSTGSIDSIPQIADVTTQENVWLHVDGAYGASIILSTSYAHEAEGVNRADSLSWDAHKWLFATYGCGMLFVREKNWLAQAFSAHSEFINEAGRRQDHEFWDLGLELTRPARAMRLWFILRVLGKERIGDMLDHGVRLAEMVEVELRKRSNWTVVSPAKLAILCFRYECPERTGDEQDFINHEITERMLQQNRAALRPMKYKGRTVLRMCIVNPRLTEEEVMSVVDGLEEVAQEVAGSVYRN